MPVTYPISADVVAAQPTAYQHYNNLRADALRFGAAAADATTLGAALARYADNLVLAPLATNRLMVPYDPLQPCTLMVDGHLCQIAAEVDLAPNTFSGGAAQWWLFANWSAGNTTFTLSANTSQTEAAGQRRIGSIYWDGSNLTYPSLIVYAGGRPGAYYARVNRTAVQSLTTGVAAMITFDTKEADTDSMWSAGSPTKLTIVHPGLYLALATLGFVANATNVRYAGIFLNGSSLATVANMTSSASFGTTIQVAALQVLKATDYLELNAYQNSGGPLNTAAPTNLTVAALSA